MTNHPVAGMVTLVVPGSGLLPDHLRTALKREGLTPASEVGGVWISTWGLPHPLPRPDAPLLLSSTNFSDSGRVPMTTLAAWLQDGAHVQLARMLPPFAALGLAPGGLRLATDQLGFRPVYTCAAEGWSAISTSARLLSRLLGGGLDEQGVLLQSQLGWQLGSLTFFDGVKALGPGESLFISPNGIRTEFHRTAIPQAGTLPLDDGVREAADDLRSLLEAYLDETDSPTLQLTGGQDSRIVLSAIPPKRRKGLKVMTLETGPDSADVRIAGELAARYGMRHTVRDTSGLATLSPAEWFERVRQTAGNHDCMADPVARSVTGWAEEYFEQGHRLSGLGGEVARGFYYHGLVRPQPITRRRVERLAKWRMLANDAVEPAALGAPHRDRARRVSLDLVEDALRRAGSEWFTATDELYLQRMQRWAGLGESTVAFRRHLTNPMLDHRFVSVARRLSPSAKRNAQFLARLQVELDEELASIPLDNRPAPVAYANQGLLTSARTGGIRLTRLGRKVRQRLTGAHRPPPGGAVVAGKLAEHFRQVPAALDPVRSSGVFDERWLDGVAAGDVRPTAGSLALLMNVLVDAEERVG